ncbi:murein hydrolase activator EnvC family protein [Rheinheimera maricola]|uniref:Peptidoglycan DD-metalloendopeptidase family protein n=1 Tax=Rheinheimera maricola TaxID=2793282 RepID=A0ABS7X7V1_9GAMM|nr:peptidoglycan DD-metalloendopeptidase family protein [Rheinheimera maricola]MBZ9611240.1 peptidoglycan DD-metalloendopeptidase family protein [Rheinheimera maricola]
MSTLSTTKKFQQCCWLLLLLLPGAFAQQAQQEQLADVKQQIQLTEQEVKQQRAQLEQAETMLQRSDRALAQASAEVNDSKLQHKKLVDEQQKLLAEQTALEHRLQQQQTALAAQLKSAYSIGQHDYSRMLLNQQDAGKLERVLTYYQYFNRARIKQLAELNHTITQLQQVLEQLTQQQQQVAATLETLQTQQKQLVVAKSQQQQAVAKLQIMLKTQGRQLDYLRQNENSLLAKLDELNRLAQQARELLGLGQDKGKLIWPLSGSLLQRFGDNRQGGMPSRGIIIQSNEGEAVKSIADGQVIYADWLKGYGWVIVLDHGVGFMSLYGHNQNLLKKPGARINAGEAIALAGMSGGQSVAGLYFEIRNKGEAVNPLQWLRQKPR